MSVKVIRGRGRNRTQGFCFQEGRRGSAEDCVSISGQVSRF